MPGRSFSSSTVYSFGFGGHEKVDEISGNGNQIDMGARYLDTRLSRTSSIDPKSSKYPWASPYSFAGDNPIFMVDQDGRDNIIYLLALPSSKASLTKQNVDDIVTQANTNFKNMGLKTEVKLIDPESFNIKKIDATDAVAVLGGSKSDVVGYVEKNLDKSFASDLKSNWDGGASNPESSKNDRGASTGNIIAIDASGLEGFAGHLGLNDESDPTVKAGALTLNHGAGHNAGKFHAYDESPNTLGENYSESVIMSDGDQLSKILSNPNSTYPKSEDVTNNKANPNDKTKNRNQDYVNSMKKRFGDNPPTDNRSKK